MRDRRGCAPAQWLVGETEAYTASYHSFNAQGFMTSLPATLRASSKRAHSSILCRLQQSDGPHLGAAGAAAGAAGGPRQRLVQRRHLDDQVAAEHLFGLGERPVEHLALAVA